MQRLWAWASGVALALLGSQFALEIFKQVSSATMTEAAFMAGPALDGQNGAYRASRREDAGASIAIARLLRARPFPSQ
jgi:hypothetical protein